MSDGLNWNMLAHYPDAGQAVMQGFHGGRQMGQEIQTQNALAAYSQNPDDPQAIAALTRVDPKLGIQLRERKKQEDAAKLQQAREQIVQFSRMLDGVSDEATFQQARQAAQGLGWDLSQVPPNFDPNWLQQQKMQARALSGQIERKLMTVTPGSAVLDEQTGQEVYKNPARPHLVPTQPGGGVFNADTGGWAVRPQGAPDVGGSQEEYIAQDEQGNTVRFNPQSGAWEPVEGGAGQAAPQTFP